MDESVNKRIMRILTRGMLLLAVSASAAAVENLPDPTRPVTSQAIADRGAASSGPVLQSVLVASGRRVAMVDGQTVKVGDKVGEARVVKIAESEVVLRNGKELKTLKLFPGIDKRQASGGTTAKAEIRR